MTITKEVFHKILAEEGIVSADFREILWKTRSNSFTYDEEDIRRLAKITVENMPYTRKDYRKPSHFELVLSMLALIILVAYLVSWMTG